MLNDASEHFDWTDISPTIFGGVFESTLNPETRRSGGMHYTSVENIRKVIKPLFLDDLQYRFEKIKAETTIKAKKQMLIDFQYELSKLKFLDPACGSGNFLTQTFLELRSIENEIIKELVRINKKTIENQMQIGEHIANPIKISINQFYGIEINDFAVSVAKTALWIAEHQMFEKTRAITYMKDEFLPLRTYTNIAEGNALRIDWEDVVSPLECNYIMGNPPFVGARLMSTEQKQDIAAIFTGVKNAGNIDYVGCWYIKVSDYIKNTNIKTALVSTNSICQGEQPAILWKKLMHDGIVINFAYRTFRWDSEASLKAHVHCIIVGFSYINNKNKYIFDDNKVIRCNNINAYLIDADNVIVESRKHPISNAVEIGIGNKPIDGGNYLFTDEEKKEFIKKEPLSEKYFKRWYGSQEFINNKTRWCLFLKFCPPEELRKMPHCMERINNVKKIRLDSKSEGTRKLAEYPLKFHIENFPNTNYIVLPETSSERRKYIPFGFMTPDVLCSNALRLVPNASLYDFGVLESNVHMAWMRTVAGRLKSDYRYSIDIVYNNFPWPLVSDKQKEKIEKTAQNILNIRNNYPNSSLADLYDPNAMPQDLFKAHKQNDAAVMEAYGFDWRKMSESDCVSKLMKMYQKLVEEKE